MRKLILEEWMSLDGFVEDGNGKLDFFTQTTENKMSDEDQLKFLDSTDTILLGRKTYELFADFWPTEKSQNEIIADKLNELSKIVVSGTLEHAPWGKWPDANIISRNVIEEIRKMKSQPGKDLVIWGSISLAQSLIAENLIDQYRIQICPTAVGQGKALFSDLENYRKLKLVSVKKYDTGVVKMHYES